MFDENLKLLKTKKSCCGTRIPSHRLSVSQAAVRSAWFSSSARQS